MHGLPTVSDGSQEVSVDGQGLPGHATGTVTAMTLSRDLKICKEDGSCLLGDSMPVPVYK